MTLDDLKRVHWELDAALARSGAFLDDLFFCPHHPERGFPGEVPELKIDCTCRKPKPGMLLAAAERHNIDLSRSYFIGDDMRDMLAGEAVGVACCLLGGGRQSEDKPGFRTADTLLEAVEDILAREKVAA
jgi:D-glycero-D-manno-heptose 1,7-bisphosphate phosphatase